MKLAIMQPYLFPYLGYFQLISAVDTFVVYDDAQYMKGGWINRNRILVNGEPKYITLPTTRSEASDLLINQRHFVPEFQEAKLAVLRQIEAAYRKAPYFAETLQLVQTCFQCDDTNVALFVAQSIRFCCQHLGISTPIKVSSALAKDANLRAQERVIDMNKVLGADQYLNATGGRELYRKEDFAEHGITLSFIQMHDIHYVQFDKPFTPNLSILDVLMFNPPERSRELLTKFDIT